VAVEFAGGAKLLAVPGLTGATGNIYVGLHDLEDMAFLLHALRPNDLFADVGANVGSFTVLASAVVGARSVCFEPASRAFEWLLSNIRINRIEGLVVARREAVGGATGYIEFTQTLDSINHVVPVDASAAGYLPNETANVPMTMLDAALKADCPQVIKIDVEGFETDVIRGAGNIMRNPELLAVIMELNGSGARYGHDEAALRAQMQSTGFYEYSYAPFDRALHRLEIRPNQPPGNFIFIRDIQKVRRRVEEAPAVDVRGVMV
jgi:FkbM family methyltransferase